MTPVWVIGGGPAGLMAADQLSKAGLPVIVVDHKPSIARKFLMAGKSGLNLTMDEPDQQFQDKFMSGQDWLGPMLNPFGPQEVKAFATGLGQDIFTGSSGRVFPRSMKASPLLRAWLQRLESNGVYFRTRWRWTGWSGHKLRFQTPEGERIEDAAATVLAMGGGSWARLGSDGSWASILKSEGIDLATLQPSNSATRVPWSEHMAPHFGAPLKAIKLTAGGYSSRGEVVLTASGLEGGGVYAVTPGLRAGGYLTIDLLPDLSIDEIVARFARTKPRESTANSLRKALGLSKPKQAILNEFARPLPNEPTALARMIKATPIDNATLGDMDGAISTAGGVRRSAVDDNLMLVRCPGTFVAGEMLDWDAPTGGYLITACLATGAWAGKAAAAWARAARQTKG